MDATTLLVVVGGVVAVKTTVILGLVARRDRRQRRRVDSAVTAARRVEASGWALQWAEPGVLLVSNASRGSAAREVELTATLTASSGESASVEHAEKFVGTGASFQARFAELERWLADVAAHAWVDAGRESAAVRDRLSSTLTYSILWRSPEGERCHETRSAHPVLPVPDLALGPA
ncbi:hypothetical protein [Microlunatus flavus]|uniref:Uncharacterized protein n=1 Tax=Microlunatus flavus TaxID=1036181 RepID=A0A1H9GW95_9ACTN|nr:hypothetical protein [Microlunatus flavus]SEQ54382.1 hypothetical protein SAMN05421756_10430 [Microlunatus flavus]